MKPCLLKLDTTLAVVAIYPFLHSCAVICDTVWPERYPDNANASAWISQFNVGTSLDVQDTFCTPCLCKLSATSVLETLYPCRHSCLEICGAARPVLWAASANESAWAFQRRRGGSAGWADVEVFWTGGLGLRIGLERGGVKGPSRAALGYCRIICLNVSGAACQAI